MDNQEKLLEWITASAQKTGDLIEREAPAFAVEAVSMYFWRGVLFAVAGIILSAIGAWMLRATYNYVASFKESYKSCPATTMGGGFGGLLCLGAGIALLVNGADMAVKATVAPRVVIVHVARFGG